jgi:hypothetical protein
MGMDQSMSFRLQCQFLVNQQTCLLDFLHLKL